MKLEYYIYKGQRLSGDELLNGFSDKDIAKLVIEWVCHKSSRFLYVKGHEIERVVY